MKVLVTGGAGYIGSHTVVELFSAGHTPVIVDNFCNSEKWIIDRIEEISGKRPMVYEGDCADSVFLASVFKQEENIEAVIHFAGYKAVGESIENPLKYYRNNLNTLIALLEIMPKFGTEKLVFSSSATVYGESDTNPITETAPRKKAESPYGTTKMMCEDIIEDATKSVTPITAIALRYFNPIGAHTSGRIGELPKGVPNNLVPYITQTASGVREKLTIFGDNYNTPDGTCVRDFIHVVDLAKAHIASLKRLNSEDIPVYDVFNVGTGQGNSVLELVKLFEKVNNLKLSYEIGPRRAGDIVSCYAGVGKIEKEMGWQAEQTLEESLKDSWRWEQQLTKESK